MIVNPKEIQLKTLIETLQGKNVAFANLVIVTVGNEQYLGEAPTYNTVYSGDILKPTGIALYNAKRFARYESRHPQNAAMIYVDFIIGDVDFLDDGPIYVSPSMGYRLSEQSLDCQILMAKLYLEYFERKIQTRAAEAGLVAPSSGIIKGR